MKLEEEKIKFAVLGFGHIGKRHAHIISQHPRGTLSAAIDTNPSVAAAVLPFRLPFFHSLEAFLQQGPPTDVMVIATPNYLHAAHAVSCLRQHKHVVIEKPMALNTREAEAIVRTAAQEQQQVFVVKQNRYSPPVAWLKDTVRKGIFGKIYSVQLNCFWNRDERYYTPGSWHCRRETDGGSMFTQFSHFIDIFYWLFGDVTNIRSSLHSFNHTQLTDFEDSGVVTFNFGEGSMGCLTFSTAVWDKNFESSITVIAENGTVKIGGQYMDSIDYCHIKNYTLPQLPAPAPANNYGAYSGSAANHYWVIENVIDVLKHNKPVTTGAAEGLAVVNLIERIYNAAGYPPLCGYKAT